MCQHSIDAGSLTTAQTLLCQWEREFEDLYYQYHENRLHFIRPCVHQVVHLVSETIRKGPPICYAQWTMERTIGNLGQEIRQPSNPYANLAQEGVRRCRVNSLLAAMPELKISSHQRHPDTAVNLGDGFTLLLKRDRYFILPTPPEAEALQRCLPEHAPPVGSIKRWARLRLKNDQTARSTWRETLKDPEKLRVSRNVTVWWFSVP